MTNKKPKPPTGLELSWQGECIKAFQLGFEAGKQQGKLDQSFLSADKNLGKNEMTAKELVELAEKKWFVIPDGTTDDYKEGYKKGQEALGNWLKSQLEKKVKK